MVVKVLTNNKTIDIKIPQNLEFQYMAEMKLYGRSDSLDDYLKKQLKGKKVKRHE